jgi:serine/threonine protein kinase
VSTLINRNFQSWIVREAIGAGGAAEVFRVEHADDPRSVAALKVLRAERAQERAQVQALTREHELLAELDHPGIPKARRLGEIDGRPALLMDFVPGRTVAQLETSGEGYGRASVLRSLAGIVAYLHRLEIVHNDLKPENLILASTGALALVDFGSARTPHRTSLFRRFFGRPKGLFGTVAYVAPELIAGHQPTFASDLYALGICSFMILSSALPFAASSRSSRLRAHANETPPSIRERLPQLPPRMAKTIDACLDKRPTARPDADAFVAALDGLERFLPPDTPRSRRFTMRTSRRTRTQRAQRKQSG